MAEVLVEVEDVDLVAGLHVAQAETVIVQIADITNLISLESPATQRNAQNVVHQ